MEEEKKSVIKNVATYTDDMIKVLETDTGGIIKKIIQEEEEREVRKKNLSPESVKNKAFLFTAIALSVLAVVGVFLALVFSEKILTAPVEPQFTPIIFTDKNSFAEIDGLTDKKDIAAMAAGGVRSSEVKLGGVEGIHLAEGQQVISFSELVTKTKSAFPKEALSLVGSEFLFGAAHTAVDTKDPFILFKVRSFADIFPHMRTWENKMFTDLHEFFEFELTPATSYLQVKAFEDSIVNNKNARILYDNEGNIVFMYVFADETSIIIADSVPAVTEVMDRLAGSKIRK